jgi:imidazole glycerol-phosphate synthase subunit HisH
MSGATRVAVVRTGTANIASITAAFERLGVGCVVTEDAGLVGDSELVVLPGVGSFRSGMDLLASSGMEQTVRDRVDQGRALLGICLGMQLFAASSEESPGVRGLGVLDMGITAFAGSVASPQLGWNTICAEDSCRVLKSGTVYYANSYKMDSVPAGWSGATSEHGALFVGGLERGSIVLCQFHPELSGSYGAGLLRRWIEASEGVAC